MDHPATGGASSSASTTGPSGGETASAGGDGSTTNEFGTGGSETGTQKPTPRYYPVPGFEDCKHAEVKEDCEDGWCKLPSSCFVMGSPEDEWERGLNTENQVAITLTHSIEVQQTELTRGEWTAITELTPAGPETCTDTDCPVAMVSWWDAVMAADLLSHERGLEACYAPVDCSGSLGVDLECAAVADPEKSVYECEGYRLPTRAEVEYAARAGTWSTWYSGDITKHEDNSCHSEPALNEIAWYCENSDGTAHAVGGKQKNGFGAVDLIGNIYEWVGGTASTGHTNPQERTGARGRADTFGGFFKNEGYLMRSANRLSLSSSLRFHELGFRLYRTLFDDSERSKAIAK